MARMTFDNQGEHESRHAAIRSIAAQVGCPDETLRNRVRHAAGDLRQGIFRRSR